MITESSKKVCFVVPRAFDFFFPGKKQIAGGAEKQCYLFAKELAKNNRFKIFFCLIDNGQDCRIQKDGIELLKIHKLSDNVFKSLKKIIKKLKNISADVYIFRAANVSILPLSVFIKVVLKKKVVYMMASDSEIFFKSLKNKNGFFTALFMKLTHKYVDILTVQNLQQEELMQKQRKQKKTVLLRNIIESSFSKQGLNRKFTLWIGRLVPIKKAEIFIELAEKFPCEKFVMVAPITPEHISYGEKLVDKIQRITNIDYLNFVPYNEIGKFYIDAKIFVITSELEGFSNTMMEAMASKCAVLSLNVNPDNIFDKYNSGIFVRSNKDEFFKSFSSLSSNQKLVQEYSENAYSYLTKNHNKDEIVNRLVFQIINL